MSKYIAAAVVLILLMTFPMQYATQLLNHARISKMQAVVHAAKEQAKQDGYFTSSNISRMKSTLSKEFAVAESEITINVTTSKKYRINGFDQREMIEYEVGVPVKKIVAAGSLWGISDKENQSAYYIKGSVASEALPDYN